jgi:predicted permease
LPNSNGISLAIALAMESLLYDVRHAVRTLLRTPAWTLMAVLTLALGVGANTAVFSFVDALLFRPAPGVSAGRALVSIYTSDFSSGPWGSTSYPDFVSMQTGTSAFAELAAEDDSGIAPLRIGEEVERVRVSGVSGRYFTTIGSTATIGRTIVESDTQPASAPVAMISYALWQRAFAADPAVIGTTAALNDRTVTIVGVAGERFRGVDIGRSVDVWIPLTPPPATPKQRGSRGLSVLARLRPGVSLREAQAQVTTLAARLAAEFPQTNLGTLERPHDPRPMFAAGATRIHPRFRGQVVMLSSVLMGGVGLVLMLACANVASLFLSRATARARELAMRRALGASSFRLVRQLMTESAVLAAAAAGLGLLFAAWTADALPSFFPAEQAAALDAAPGMRVFAFAGFIAGLSALVVGILPASRATQIALSLALRGSAGDITERYSSRTRNVLVSVQVAIACILLVGAALLAQSVAGALRADLGFTTRDALLTSVELPAAWAADRGRAFYEQARDRVAALPGVDAAAWVRTLPLARPSRRGFRPDGYVRRPGEDLELHYNIVSSGYFETMGISLLEGRTFTPADTAASRRVVVVNDTLARRFYNGSAIGRAIGDSADNVFEIIGVVRSGKNTTVTEPPVPLVYYSSAQSHTSRLSLVVRTGNAPARLADDVKREMRNVSRDVPIFRTMTLRGHIEEALGAERLTASLVSVCGVFALLLAIVGLYGAISYLVVRRTREIGVRIALGAEPRHVVALVVRHGLWIALSGVIVGIVGATAASRALSTFLYGISAVDGRTYAAVALGLLALATVSAYIPASRAVRIDPARALSVE